MPTRILIADDNEIVRSRLVEIVDGYDGWKVCGAVGNGQEAVEKAIELNPDIIVLDLAMPVMDGLSATREILRTTPTVPIVIYTLHNIPAIELEAKKAGARKVVLKPHADLLISALEEIVATESMSSDGEPITDVRPPPSRATSISDVTEEFIAKKSTDSTVAQSITSPADAPIGSVASASSAAPDGAEMTSAPAEGDASAPPAIGEPESSA